MLLGLGIRDRDQNCSTCWPLLEIGYKTIFITIVISTTVFLIFPAFGVYFPNSVKQVIEQGQVWRLLSSFLFEGITLKVILGVLFNLLVLYICLPDIVSNKLLSKRHTQQLISLMRSLFKSYQAILLQQSLVILLFISNGSKLSWVKDQYL